MPSVRVTQSQENELAEPAAVGSLRPIMTPTAFIVIFGGAFMIAIVLGYVMLRGGRAVDRMHAEQLEKWKKEEESRKLIADDGTVVYPPGPPRPGSRGFPNSGDSAYGSADLPTNHYP